MQRPVYRYDVSAAELLVQMLNYTNNRTFTADQLVFGVPVAGNDTVTQISVTASPTAGWSGTVMMTYRRLRLEEHFAPVPIVVYAPDLNTESILLALQEQYHLYFDRDLVDLAVTPVSLTDVITTTTLNGLTTDPTVYGVAEPVNAEVVLTVRPEHPFWMGSLTIHVRQMAQFIDGPILTTLAVKEYFTSDQALKIPLDLVVDFSHPVEDPDYELYHYKVDDLLLAGMVDTAKAYTGDAWVFSDQPQPFNLFAAKVIYNGANQQPYYTQNPKASRVLVFELSPQYCTNLQGRWLIGYYDPQVYANRVVLDALPSADL